jgi:glycosyltransferase involved in cell wall biosynthesis
MDLDRKVASVLRHKFVNAVYCYEDTALETFREAKRQGLRCLYDLPIGYWRAGRRLLADEAERRPEWLPTMAGLKDSEEKLARKDAELRLADRILVASSFTKMTLQECPFPIAPITVIPYGANDVLSPQDKVVRSSAGSVLRILFVGGLSQRKGIADLFEAVDTLGAQVELTVIGRRPAAPCQALDSALRKHRWIESLPREQILEQMRAHDVLVFPSLFEGFGLVVTEALSQGLPVITTPHTCGPDVLTDGEDGFMVPIRDPQAIAEKLELLHRDRERLAAMSEAASEKAKMLTWESYRHGIVTVVREALSLNSA